jgi:hypothetical protein
MLQQDRSLEFIEPLNFPAGQGQALVLGTQLEHPLAVDHAPVAADRPRLLETQDLLEVQGFFRWAMQIGRGAGRPGKADLAPLAFPSQRGEVRAGGDAPSLMHFQGMALAFTLPGAGNVAVHALGK